MSITGRGTSWSPEGTQIVFHSTRFTAESGPGHSSFEIFIMNADGSDQVRLTNNNFQDSLPSFSPDAPSRVQLLPGRRP